MEIPEIDYQVFMDGKPFRMGIYGNSGTGKTTFVLNMWNKIKDYNDSTPRFDFVEIFTLEHNVQKYKNVIGKRINGIHINVSTFAEDIKKLSKFQNDNLIMMKNPEYKRDSSVPEYIPKLNKDGSYRYKYDILVIFDDIIDKKLSESTEFANMFAAFRNLNISVIFIIQTNSVFITPTVRAQFNYCVLFQFTDYRQRNMILQQFFWESVKDFMKEHGKNVDDLRLKTITQTLYVDLIEGNASGTCLITKVDDKPHLLYKLLRK